MIHKIGIVGCGLIGEKRAANLGPKAELCACFDDVRNRSGAIAERYGGVAASSLEEILESQVISAVIVATNHRSLPEIGERVIKSGKHLFLEKPGARHWSELCSLQELSKKSNSVIRVGYNHRYHAHVQKMYSLISEGQIGDLMFMRARYGHGGRVGYNKEWRAQREISGGGELIDQGAHLIDLASMIFGDLELCFGKAVTTFWDMEVDDNAFLLLKNEQGALSQIHVSCTEWKNLFSVEIYGKTGKIELQGLGGSYGVERLTLYSMRPEMGPPDTRIWEYPRADDSWNVELEQFFTDIDENRIPNPGIKEAMTTLKLIDGVYEMSCDQTPS